MNNSIIKIEGLGKKYSIGTQAPYLSLRDSIMELFRPQNGPREQFWALQDLNLDIEPGETLGVIGRNGAGKSTLLKLLSRITPPTTGKITLRGRVASLLEVGTGFHPELSGRENIYLNGAILGMSRQEIKRKFAEIVAFSEIEAFLDTPVKRYSSGMYVRLAFAVAAHLEPEILIVDEVLAVGDAEFQKKCLGKMQSIGREGRTVIFVSHNMSAIKQLCHSGLLLDHGKSRGIMPIDAAILQYIAHAKQVEQQFLGKAIRHVAIRQEDDRLVLTAQFVAPRPIKLPCLGFVISDAYGTPICGTNPIVDRPHKLPTTGTSGTITATILQPKLLDGTYNLSIWFGDGIDEFFSAKDCLTFDVLTMIQSKQLPPSDVGPVWPKVVWKFGA